MNELKDYKKVYTMKPWNTRCMLNTSNRYYLLTYLLIRVHVDSEVLVVHEKYTYEWYLATFIARQHSGNP